MKKLKLLYIFFLLVTVSCINENGGSILLNSENKYFKAKEVQYYQSEKSFEIEDLLVLASEGQFQIKREEYMSFGITQDSVYLYFDLERVDESEWILELPYPPLTKIRVYQIDKYDNEYSH